jgi:RimJ/RimL family protein N-acetyltransferase
MQDSVDIWNWRNDFSTKVNSLNQTPINWESHQKWLREVLTNKKDFIYIGLLLEEKIGMCRFKHIDGEDTLEVSINLNPQFRGQRLSSEFLQRSIEELFSVQDVPNSLVAIVRESNLPSIKLFK